MTKIVVDPVTRIEGHLRVEARVEDGFVREAWCAGTQFRGMELILPGRDPRDAWLFAQRICGVCTTVHALASVRAVEDALQIEIPPNAKLLRELMAGIQFVQDHVVHFYHLHALDWIDPAAALEADAKEAAQFAAGISDWAGNTAQQFQAVQDQLKALVASGQLSIFTNAYFGHPSHRLSPKVNLMLMSHYLEALRFQREIVRAHALLGGKNPHPQTYLVGGMAIPLDLGSDAALNATKIAQLKSWFAQAQGFVRQVYYNDALALATFYKEWFSLGRSAGNYLCYGGFPDPDNAGEMFPSGVLLNGDLQHAQPADQAKISEYVTRSWFSYDQGDLTGKHPSQGQTKPEYTGPQAQYDELPTDGKYSWNKAPRYNGEPMEVGPLARVLLAYAQGQPRVKALADGALQRLGVSLDELQSTMGRIVARALETVAIADALPGWLAQLETNIAQGDVRIHNNGKWSPASWPAQAQGQGFHEAPRGGLGHWVRIESGKIAHYQCVVPTTWNASPRDHAGRPGPYETALAGTPVADPERPVEVLRTVHSFDPCMACAAHLVDARGRELTRVRVV